MANSTESQRPRIHCEISKDFVQSLVVINDYLQEKGLSFCQGAIIDATITHAVFTTLLFVNCLAACK